MAATEPTSIGIIGGGLMGHGIALVMARGGHHVNICDPDAASRNSLHQRVRASLKGMGVGETESEQAIGRISVVEEIAETVAETAFVFEAAPEKLALKQSIFAEIEQHAPTDCVLASNTSVIQISLIMEGLESRHRALGTHWWNPPHMIPLVEVVKTDWVEDSAMTAMMDLLAAVGKTPVRVEKDVPGFIGNRLQHALWREAISLVENGICDARAVDTVIKASFGRRLAVLGPLENADLVGTDLTLDIHENVLFDLESRKAPSPYLEKLVKDGKLGMKSGEGFRNWTAEEADELRKKVPTYLSGVAGLLKE
ncbi:MAG: 3-hydroxyacyl-CoA dehydrogenase family protein [Rhizobiaceae bacterium]